ncbi:sensor histidine kinase - like protein [Thioalkalivibrio nitratireducens DSM 14787]|uniref:histidine kinase n=1 Tax=Thioalkalivibrio nitratireducens (strain DSM 14787 / UNIQEM 213 / ALEN2) TaxID=1255043 RepID=L0DUH0_THIND|nr:HAMP domain-containing sensor histidine kinase [Thioalkalivibrio nitratireducens]AGA32640.1 sensor histidine kinase - like protein [Thioalkalivibrio nitratireducens DSM 14787]
MLDLMLRNLSLRYRLPLQASLLVLTTALLLTGAILLREYQQGRQDLFETAESTARLLAATLVQPLLHDDLWRAHALINAPFDPEDPWPLAVESVLILDADQRVYVSTEPRRYRLGTPVGELDPPFAYLRSGGGIRDDEGFRILTPRGADHFLFELPVHFDGMILGSLALAYPRALLIPRFLSIVTRAGLVLLVMLLLLLPLTWWWGRRVVQPLVHLSHCMSQMRERLPPDEACDLPNSGDEIGDLGREFRRLLTQLRQKQALEESMLASERLATVGRITAGIAHEINNPLGGMLNAISTHRRHGDVDPLTARTLSLLDRGLNQIRDTVGALLVEARVTSHALEPQDLEDVRTLVSPDAQQRKVEIEWDNRIEGRLDLPSSQVRQILMNLLLNAVQASDPGATVRCSLRREGDGLQMSVVNRGDPIPREQMERLFEPFVSGSPSGSGLGLWVTYQLVSQMDGRIEVESGDDRTTRFDVFLPPARAAA